jgi:hypothetical protein
MRAAKINEDRNDVPTYRHEEFAAYQSGRDFDEALLERLDRIPEFVAACGFQNAKAPSFEADDFLASAAKAEEKRGGTVLIGSGDRYTFQLASIAPPSFTPSERVNWRGAVLPKSARATASIRRRFRTTSPCAAIPPTSCLERGRRGNWRSNVAPEIRKP